MLLLGAGIARTLSGEQLTAELAVELAIGGEKAGNAVKIIIPKERQAAERRVAASPDTVKKFTGYGLEVLVESGAGAGASFEDHQFVEAGAVVSAHRSELLAEADVILKVQPPEDDELAQLRPGAILVGLLAASRDSARAYAERGIEALALELLPRISRCQSMDALSSQASLAGYRAVIEAAWVFARAFPMMMTAAGTIPPTRCLVMGAGVAGLQAIATARRMGAIVTATDVRAAVAEQVRSLGATFVAVEDQEFKQAETASGYAQAMSEDYLRKQAELIAQTIKKQDIVITTALIPGQAAPKLVSAEMVASMNRGSVVVDMAAAQGGNVEGCQAGQAVTSKNGVIILGYTDLASRVANNASAMYARNLLSFLGAFIDPPSAAVVLDWDDEIIRHTALTRAGQVIHPRFI